MNGRKHGVGLLPLTPAKKKLYFFQIEAVAQRNYSKIDLVTLPKSVYYTHY